MGKQALDSRFYLRAIGVDIPPETLVTVALRPGYALSVKKNSKSVGNAARYEGVVVYIA
jgi:hypothetical protein